MCRAQPDHNNTTTFTENCLLILTLKIIFRKKHSKITVLRQHFQNLTMSRVEQSTHRSPALDNAVLI